ncbi:hypothetical protein [Telmatospirillum sp.]|uniref:hypothetical protein n=1 Tax=Telmatospirillum sp. TaxID=2079197 RepID=UPI00284A45F9|nr:hypothetical protein [Telmatospirillum sp.]MDR3438683.1 hypothetical protein [Telmatospirillum sp.]
MSDEATPPPAKKSGVPDASPGSDPRVVFESAFFKKLEDACFHKAEQSGEVVLTVRFAKNYVSLPFRGIKREFKIADDSPDGQMLEQVTKALKYVKGLRVGDPLPKEILTREASWQLSDRHLKIAYQRVSVQLVNWLTGDQDVVTDPDELLQLADDPQIKKAVNRAFGEAAEQLGLGRDHKEEVIHHVETLARELAYIEALRDRFRRVRKMEENIQALRRLYGRERSVLEIADQVARLGERAVADFTSAFLEVDAQTGEILSVLRNLDSQIAYIRDTRDDIYAKLMAWDDVLAEWDKVELKISPDKPDLLRRAYQFLAPRYMLVKEWVLMTRLQMDSGTAGVSQIGQKDGKPKKPNNVMRW